MMFAMTDTDPRDVLAALLRGEHVSGAGRDAFNACLREQLTGLVYEQFVRDPGCCDWPAEIREELARRARAAVAIEVARQQEIAAVLDRLAADGVTPILFKGTALAYSTYGAPSLRPRSDTDLIVRRSDVDAVSRVMTALGYARPPHSGGELLFRQFWLERRDHNGVMHAFDVHWRVSTQPAFADLLSYEELAADAVAVPALGVHARAAGPLHALLLACIHPVMHHRNDERLLWIYDIHVLARTLPAADLARLADLAIVKRMAAVTAAGLSRARDRLATPLPGNLVERLRASAAVEPSAVYLQPNRRWTHDLVASLRALPRWRDRLHLLREVAFPAGHYMLHAYGLGRSATPLLPVLYSHRILRGAWQMLGRRK